MDEVAEDREGAGVSVLDCERDGIANAEAHAEVGRSKDTHTYVRHFSVLRDGDRAPGLAGVVQLKILSISLVVSCA